MYVGVWFREVQGLEFGGANRKGAFAVWRFGDLSRPDLCKLQKKRFSIHPAVTVGDKSSLIPETPAGLPVISS